MKTKKNVGRKKKENSLKLKYPIKTYLNEEEHKKVMSDFEGSGIKKFSVYLRKKINLKSGSHNSMVNNVELIRRLDKIGAEISRIGNNINQFARYSNILIQDNRVDNDLLEKFSNEMGKYIKTRKELINAYRTISNKL